MLTKLDGQQTHLVTVILKLPYNISSVLNFKALRELMTDTFINVNKDHFLSFIGNLYQIRMARNMVAS